MKQSLIVPLIMFVGFSSGCAGIAGKEGHVVAAPEAYGKDDQDHVIRLLEERMKNATRDYECAMAKLKEMTTLNGGRTAKSGTGKGAAAEGGEKAGWASVIRVLEEQMKSAKRDYDLAMADLKEMAENDAASKRQ